MKISPAAMWTVLLPLVVASCAGTLDDPESYRRREPATEALPVSAPAACPDVTQTVFASATTCASAGCHGAANPAQGLDLASPGLAMRLADQEAKRGGFLVDPSAPEQSVLYRSLLPGALPSRMPLGGTPLDEATLACVKGWIAKEVPARRLEAPDGGPTIDPAPGGTVVRVAAGAAAPYTDPAGHVWSADTGFTGGNTSLFPTSSISGTNVPELYKAQRLGEQAAGAILPFRYVFAVVKGRYTVTLKLAENWFTGPGLRQFNVAINGKAVLTNFDVYATAGKDVASDRAFPVDMASDGQIAIDFTPGATGEPKVNAIEIVPAK